MNETTRAPFISQGFIDRGLIDWRVGDRGSIDEGGNGEMSEANASIDPKLLEILVCPVTKETLEYDAAAQELISRKAGLAYPIRDGIPIMLPDEARQLDD